MNGKRSGGMTERDLGCREILGLVTEYLEGTLPPGQRRRFEEHLRRCDGCETYLEQMRQTIEALGALREDSLSPAARERLLAAFRGWRPD
jgi:anti-sigma factor RsiW